VRLVTRLTGDTQRCGEHESDADRKSDDVVADEQYERAHCVPTGASDYADPDALNNRKQ